MFSPRITRRRAALSGAVALAATMTLGACGGSDASPSTTLQPLGPTNFATIPPVDDTSPTDSGVDNPIPEEQLYEVQSGDVLFSIADNFGVTAQEIADYNDWEDGINHAIYPGDSIKIPGGARPVETDPPETDPPETDPPDTTLAPGAGGTYEVQAGDFLAKIAAQFDTTPQAIVEANGWSDGIDHAIFPGDIINLP